MQDNPQGCSDEDLQAIRNLLFFWCRLSPGDVSVIQAALKTPGAFVNTVEGCPHFNFWANLCRLGWAERTAPPPGLPDMEPRPAFFTLTAAGQDRVPAFLAQFSLRYGTFYTPPRRDRDPAWFDRVLESAAQTYLEGRSYRGFTPVAAARLRQLDSSAVALTLSTYAGDVKATAAGLRMLAEQGKTEAASTQWLDLLHYIDRNRAWSTTSLEPPHPPLRELGARLDLGLGHDLDEWLRAPTLRLPLLGAWLGEFGPQIDRFVAHAVAWSKSAQAAAA
jgi:hypothetical protein